VVPMGQTHCVVTFELMAFGCELLVWVILL
jgi:hypothetical protein